MEKLKKAWVMIVLLIVIIANVFLSDWIITLSFTVTFIILSGISISYVRILRRIKFLEESQTASKYTQ